LDYLSRRFNSTQLPVYQRYVLHLINSVYDRLGFTDKSTDSRLDVYLRMLITGYACKYGHEPCISAAKLEFEHMETSSTYKILANIRPTVYCTGIAEGSPDEWNYLWLRFTKENVATEKIVILRALGCTSNRVLLEKYMDFIVTDAVRLQDKKLAFESAIFGQQQNVQIVLDYVIANSEKIVSAFNGYSKLSEILSLLSLGFSNQQQITKLENFYNTKLVELGSSANMLKTAIDEVKLDLKWAEDHLQHAVDYMDDIAGSASIIYTSFTLMIAAIFVTLW